MKTIVLCVKDKRHRHKNLSCPVFSYYICWIHVYVCKYVYNEYTYMVVNMYFHVFFVIWEFPILILRFNKAYRFYLKLIPVWFLFTVYKTSVYTLSWLRFAYWYMYVYICFWYKWTRRATLWFYVLDRNDFVWKLLIFIHLTL